MKTDIIIPNWNGAEKLKRNLPFVVEAKGINKIIVVDDGSSDDSVEILKKEFPSVKLIEKPTNSGYSTTVNVGVKISEAQFVVLLNSDARPQKNFLAPALEHFLYANVFSVGCNVGGAWTGATFKDGFFWHHQAKADLPDLKRPHPTLWVSGGTGVFRKSIWDQIGGLDELFNPFYEEDLDIGYRAVKRGFQNIWEPSSVVEHYKEKGVIAANFSKDHVAKIAQRNQLIFIWKNITSEKLFSEHKKELAKMLTTHPKYWKVFLSAFKNINEINKKRQIEKNHAKLSDEEILEMFSDR